ncbi:MAG: hypothetical protein R6V85_09475 [Polyangia bacterium]
MRRGRPAKDSARCEIGSVYVEQLVLVMAVALGFAAAALTLGPRLLAYHEGIEIVLSLPIP